MDVPDCADSSVSRWLVRQRPKSRWRCSVTTCARSPKPRGRRSKLWQSTTARTTTSRSLSTGSRYATRHIIAAGLLRLTCPSLGLSVPLSSSLATFSLGDAGNSCLSTTIRSRRQWQTILSATARLVTGLSAPLSSILRRQFLPTSRTSSATAPRLVPSNYLQTLPRRLESTPQPLRPVRHHLQPPTATLDPCAAPPYFL
jgi:hypothetical protein